MYLQIIRIFKAENKKEHLLGNAISYYIKKHLLFRNILKTGSIS